MTDGNDTGPARPVEPVEILLAEDEPSDADLCIRTLLGKNVANHVVWVKDGAEALDFLFGRGRHANRAQAGRPRLLLLDIKMPRVDGFEVLRQVRADERFATMPVVMMTSSAEERDLVQGYDLGVNSYVRKPVDFASFQRAVEEVGLYWMLLNKAAGTVAGS
jgi:two-component system response regulator